MLRPQNRTNLRQFNFSDARKVIYNLLLFVFQLLLVRQNLPFTSAAYTEMCTTSSAAHLTLLYQTKHLCLHERVFLLRDLQVHNISGNTIRHKRNDIIDTHQCLSFCGYSGNLNMLKNRKILFLHRLTIQWNVYKFFQNLVWPLRGNHKPKSYSFDLYTLQLRRNAYLRM